MLTAISFILPGILCLLVFLYLNLSLQPRWFPNEAAGEARSKREPVPAPVGHALFGFLLTALMFLGVVLITMGCVEYGILTSRS